MMTIRDGETGGGNGGAAPNNLGFTNSILYPPASPELSYDIVLWSPLRDHSNIV